MKMTKNIITQKRLKKLLNYDPDTGIFVWLVSRKGVRVNAVAGTLQHGYIVISIDYKLYRAHRLAFLYMTGKFPVNQVDHDNRVRSDNRWKNLNSATNTTNHKNMPMQRNNTSGYVGVSWSKQSGKWHVYIWVSGKRIHLGFFINKSNAIKARKSAEVKYGFHINHGK